MGKVVEISNDTLTVQWPENSTSSDDLWYCHKSDVVVTDLENNGCEWCGLKDGVFKLGEILFYKDRCNEIEETYFPLKYCPNCGRKL